jgi:cysteine desulfurase NifS/selenium donor protein
MNPIYLDYNATTPIDPAVVEAMKPFLDEYFGNPSSIHSYGAKSKLAVENARKQVAAMLCCDASEIVFTSGGTESNNMAIKGAALANRHRGKHIISSAIEHPAVFEVCKYLEKEGFELTYLPVDKYGMIILEELEAAIRPDTILLSLMHANNEVGTIQPLREVARIIKPKGIIFHTDAAQSAGKIETDTAELGVDLMSIAGHKLYAPKGIGALYIKNGIRLEKFMHGADHEQNLRAGTENVLEIVGLGKACDLARTELEKNAAHYRLCRDKLHELLEAGLPGIKLNGHPEKRLPNTLSISFPKVEANTLVSRLQGVASSAGAACHAESIDVSVVLEAMKVPVDYAMGTIRFSTGRGNTEEDIKKAAEEIIETASALMPDIQTTGSRVKKGSDEIKLTNYTHGLGCACKIQPQKLEKVLQSLKIFPDKNILVGTETSDDATVYKISDRIALVQTLDFFTPIVDDPYAFGAIAAANALSDIYAMGAKPLFALNIAGFPEGTLPMSVLEQILAGAGDKAKEAGINILGGHTIEDPEPKYGMVVTGITDPARIIRNYGAREGDKLILTKALGTGIISTAMKRGLTDPELTEAAIALMSELNRIAAETMVKYSVSACTDVSGFGLLGHLREMSKASGYDVELEFNSIPFIKGAKDFATAGIIPGGSFNNLDWVKDSVDFGRHPGTEQILLCDAQTSGGLLISLPEAESDRLLSELKSKGLTNASIIGTFCKKGEGRIRII